MLGFVVFDADGRKTEVALRHAYLLGKDNIAIVGKVEWADGRIVCRKPSSDEAALALQIDTGPPGVLTLQTCLLPDRDRPYLLNLELARHRIMLFLNKLEEWGLSALPNDHPIMTAFEEARSLFTESLTAAPEVDGSYSPVQATLARRSLARAIEASEMLALHSAERQLAARLATDENTGRIPVARFGVAVQNEQFSEPLKKVLAASFDFIVSPLQWSEIEKEEGRFSFVASDRWIEWAVRSGSVSVVGGPVLDFSPRAVPGWLRVWENDYQSVREFAYEHAKRVVTRYRRTISRWNVISGVNLNQGFSFTPDQMIELTRLAVLLVRKLHPAAKVVVDVTQPFGEHASSHAQSVSPLLYTELLLESGIAIDALGLRLQFGDSSPGRSARDLMQLSDLLDTFAQFEKPIDLTAIGAPSGTDSTEETSGRWRAAWSPEHQSRWMTDAISVALGKPYIRSIAWHALFDSPACDMAFGALVSADGRAKPSLRRLAEIRAAVRKRMLPGAFIEAAAAEAAQASADAAP